MTTAAFAVIALGRNISSNKWRALLLLVIGCILVASPAFNRPVVCENNANNTNNNDDQRITIFDTFLGVGAVLVMVTISGYSSIYFEGMLKKQGERITIWERNFQLALYSTLFLIGIVM